ncbi:MAG: PEP-CTERM sorting domain-containing protein [Rhodocyclaceae bacterium]|nr:PEP-CTERM sorting domain-containing protein [Rhodocyclaceae bacterium]MBX3667658.1 PEP-CTERM sorting domain-containing protein [Rhodocyclaceae bacterium]
MKKLAQIAAAVAALGTISAANAGVAIQFDPTGNGGSTGGTLSVETFDWAPDNALSVGAFSTTPNADGSVTTTTVAQARLTGFINSSAGEDCATNIFYCAAAYTNEFTFQASFRERSTGIGSSNANFTLDTSVGSFYRIFANTPKDASNTTGGGYGNGTLIYEARITAVTGTFNDATRSDPGTNPVDLLDKNGVDNQNGVQSHQGTGNNTISMTVTFLNPAYFLSAITSADDTTSLRTSFNQVNPSDTVVGFTPSYSFDGTDKINGDVGAGTCNPFAPNGRTESGDTNTGRCDFHIQTDGSLSFNLAPEPATLGMLGLGLAFAGLSRRRSK